MLRVALLLFVAADCVLGAEVLTADKPSTTPSGATFTAPKDWSILQVQAADAAAAVSEVIVPSC